MLALNLYSGQTVIRPIYNGWTLSLRPHSEIIGNVWISKFFLCNLVHYSKSSPHTNFEVRSRERRREMIRNVFKMESGQSTLKNNFSQKIFTASCEAFKITYSHENSCKNILIIRSFHFGRYHRTTIFKISYLNG